MRPPRLGNRLYLRIAVCVILFCLSMATHASSQWYEMRNLTEATSTSTRNISLVTDMRPAQADQLWRTLLHFDQLVDHFLAEDLENAFVGADAALRVVVFAERDSFDRVVNQRHFAAYTLPGINGTTLVVGPDPDGMLLENALHEYVHYRLRTQLLAYPLWYEEGLASVLAATQFEPPLMPNMAVVGARVPDRLSANRVRTPSIEATLARLNLDGMSLAKMTGFYRQSALLVQFLTFAHLDASFADFRPPLARYLHNREENLYNTMGVAADHFAREFKRYHQLQNKPALPIPVRPLDAVQPALRQLTKRQVDEVFARTALRPNPKFAARLLGRLLDAEPDNVDLQMLRVSALREFAPSRADALLARFAPQYASHPQVLLQRAIALTEGCPMDASLRCMQTWREASLLLREAIQADPEQPEVLLWLGITELYSGNAGAAVNYLRVAYQHTPWSPSVNYHYGECLRLVGNPRAELHLTRAQLWAQDPLWKELAQKSLTLLEAARLEIN